ncbi:TetR/AcrR family transcriptional regulator [Gallaecimonas pentaromativorans]|uniref:TetR/AcrR family transcriptional regulator n=1 Tax=Gallaecimonas pentaromativorans TaxID=584787 RepID=UPI003A8E08E5
MIDHSKPADKRQLILDATGRLLALYGFHGLSMQLVAKEAGVAAGTIYRYFDSKTSMIKALHGQIIHDVAAELFRGYDTAASLRERFDYLWQCSWQLFLDMPDVLVSKYQFERLPLEADRQQMQDLEDRVFAPITAFWQEGRAQGVFKEMHDEIFATLTFEVCADLAFKQLAGKLTLTQAEIEVVRDASWAAITL